MQMMVNRLARGVVLSGVLLAVANCGRRRRAGGPAGVVLSGVLLAAATAAAQPITGSILGAVADAQGGALPGVAVVLSSDQLPGGPRTGVTDARGQYRFPNLPPGDYVLTATLPGFAAYREEGLRVRVGGTTERRVTLELAGVAETVAVTAESPVVDTRRSGVSTNFSADYLENTPLRRFSFFDFTKAAPGMSATNPTSGSSSRVSAFGSGVDENKYLMDGVDFTAPVSGAAWPWPDTDVIEEIEVVSLGASAEFGNSPGAVFNVVTRQGTNVFRGDAAYYGMYDALTAKPIRFNAAGERDPGGWGFTRNRYRDVTAHAGGPIRRDRAWIYGGYQFLQDWDNQPGTDPAHPRKFGANRVFWKLTANLTPDLRFMHTYHDDYWVIPSTPTVSEPFETGWTFSGRNPSLTFGRITHALSTSTFYEAGVSGFYSPGDLSEPNNPGVPRRNDIDNGLASGGAPTYDIFRQGRTEAKAKLHHYAGGFLNADHDFKIGVVHVVGNHSAHGGYTPGPGYPDGVVYYDNGDGTPNYILTGTPFHEGGEFRETGLFAEDVMTFGDRTTISAGVRVDHVRGISPDVDDLVLTDVRTLAFEPRGTVAGRGELYRWTNVGPRLGFNVRLDDDGATVLRGNWGRFYRTAITGELSGVHPGQATLREFYWNPATGGYDVPGPVYAPDTNFGYDPESRAPRTDQFSIGLDRALAANLALGVTYVRKDQDDLLGWNVRGASYSTVPHTFSNGLSGEIHPITTDPDDRFFQLGNVDCRGVAYRCDPMYMDYNGLVLTLDKRMADGYQAQVSYVWSQAYGLLPSSGFGAAASQTTRVFEGSLGRDPNDFINAAGHLQNDRTHTVRVTGAVLAPGGVLLGFNYAWFVGKPWAGRELVDRAFLPQGNRWVYVEPPGARRLDSQNVLDLRVSRVFFFDADGRRTVELLADVLNLFNAAAAEDIASRTLGSSVFGVGERWIDPRRAIVGVKFGF